MTSSPSKHTFLCNGATLPTIDDENSREHKLHYIGDDANVNIKLNQFVQSVNHLPEIVLDLLEMAGYIFAADRRADRGQNASVEYHNWSRFMRFIIKVRAHEFWNREEVRNKLSQALTFMTGDRGYEFEFQTGHKTERIDLFDEEGFNLASFHTGSNSVILFSGGLDSLAGTIKHLEENPQKKVLLVSHQSSQSSTKRTQNQLFGSFKEKYQSKIEHYKFECSLKGYRAREETQRTRAFLYSVVAFAIADSLQNDEIFFYENGVTSLNLPRSEDLINARASRTTHPKTIRLMTDFLSLVAREVRNDENIRVQIRNPFNWLTKADVLCEIKKFGQEELISSSVSCSNSYNRNTGSNHCGKCFQCIDRRIAAYASNTHEWDEGSIYGIRFDDDLADDSRVTVSYIRQAVKFGKMTDDQFYREHFIELEDIKEEPEEIYSLVQKHSRDVLLGLSRIREKEDLASEIPENSFYGIIADREYLKPEPLRMAKKLCEQFKQGLPVAFQNKKPENEQQLNDQIQSALTLHEENLRREFPVVKFGLKKIIPDHELKNYNLLIECKYPRETRKLSKITDEIAADITQFLMKTFILFAVYDPSGQINNVHAFESSIREIAKQKNTECLICVVK